MLPDEIDKEYRKLRKEYGEPNLIVTRTPEDAEWLREMYGEPDPSEDTTDAA